MTRISVLGAGSWGTAFSLVLADAGNDVTLWARREEVCETINLRRENTDYLPGVELPAKVTATHDTERALADAGNDVTLWARREEVCETINLRRENTDYLPGVELPAKVTATHDTERALADAEVVVFAVPSQTFRSNLEQWAPHVPSSAVMVSLMKGVELGTLKRMSEVIGEVTDAGPERVAVVSGPNLSHEISQREPAASVVACADESVAKGLQRLVHSPAFRPYTSVDVVGCELGGAYKNVVALSVGMAVGLGFGDNTTASVITRGLAETARLAMAMDADPLTLMGLAGLGDLVATCSSPLSRNRTFGEKLGLGMTTEEIVASTRQVAEGAKSCSSLLALAEKVGVDAPIAEHVEAVVDGRMTAPEMMEAFIARDTKAERD
jgi:glycerol-3-phosphate dehydrogenase (NAD(P)+)